MAEWLEKLYNVMTKDWLHFNCNQLRIQLSEQDSLCQRTAVLIISYEFMLGHIKSTLELIQTTACANEIICVQQLMKQSYHQPMVANSVHVKSVKH